MTSTRITQTRLPRARRSPRRSRTPGTDLACTKRPTSRATNGTSRSRTITSARGVAPRPRKKPVDFAQGRAETRSDVYPRGFHDARFWALFESARLGGAAVRDGGRAARRYRGAHD